MSSLRVVCRRKKNKKKFFYFPHIEIKKSTFRHYCILPALLLLPELLGLEELGIALGVEGVVRGLTLPLLELLL